MLFWASSAVVAAKMERLRAVEGRLIEFASRFGRRSPSAYEIVQFDTKIPRSTIPLEQHGFDIHEQQNEEYLIHGVHVSSKLNGRNSTRTPLVLLHGYMNGSCYFYRNIVGLSRYFCSIYSLDMLGWGLSSRPTFKLIDDSIETAEDFFVESLEAWRVQNNLDKMILAGHSMGGYVSVAYCERYPQHVERLILISPAGVLDEPQEIKEKRRLKRHTSLRSRVATAIYTHLYSNHTLGDILRVLPSSRGQRQIHDYVGRRLRAIASVDERESFAEYLYLNNTLPGSGEYCISRFLTPSVFGRKPTEHRIPRLRVPTVTFLYGENDWMDASGGLHVKSLCGTNSTRDGCSPEVEVYQVSNAGHLLMLDNWEEFNSGIVLCAGMQVEKEVPRPTKLCPYQPDHHQSSKNVAVPSMIQRVRNVEIAI